MYHIMFHYDHDSQLWFARVIAPSGEVKYTTSLSSRVRVEGMAEAWLKEHDDIPACEMGCCL